MCWGVGFDGGAEVGGGVDEGDGAGGEIEGLLEEGGGGRSHVGHERVLVGVFGGVEKLDHEGSRAGGRGVSGEGVRAGVVGELELDSADIVRASPGGERNSSGGRGGGGIPERGQVEDDQDEDGG